MIRKKRLSDKLLYAVLVFCVFSFKIVLVNLGGSGIRPDDLFMLAAFLILLTEGDFGRVKRSHAFNIYLGFVALNLVSALWGSAIGRIGLATSLLFVARLLQYMIFYFVGYRIAKCGMEISKMLTFYLTGLCVAVPLQMLGWLPVSGNFEGITTRAVGNTNGPYELAAVGAFLLCFLGYERRRPVSGFFSFGLVILSASRITFVASGLTLVKSALARPKVGRLLVISSAGIAFAVVLVAVRPDNSTAEEAGIFMRLSEAASTDLVSSLQEAYRSAPVYKTSQEYLDNTFQTAIDDASASSGDASGLIRVFRWTTLIKSTLRQLDSVLFGLGPSFASAAVDGYFVRVFIETGLFGAAIFCWFGGTLLFHKENSSRAFREYVFIMLATACFIDIFVSIKPMMLLWLWHGMHQFPAPARTLSRMTRRVSGIAVGDRV